MTLVAEGRLDPTVFATHHFALSDTMGAYDTFADAASTGALKVVLDASRRAAMPEALVGAASAG
jgi:alcohol dehydrogenase